MNQVDRLLRTFDFRKVRSAMKATGWRWTFPTIHGDQFQRVPTVDELKRAAKQILVEAQGKGPVARGGFLAQVGVGGELSLSFVLESAMVYPEDEAEEPASEDI